MKYDDRLGPERIYHVTIMPCFDKKLEASREDFFDQVAPKEASREDFFDQVAPKEASREDFFDQVAPSPR